MGSSQPALSSVTATNCNFMKLTTIQFPGNTGHILSTQEPQVLAAAALDCTDKHVFITAKKERSVGCQCPR